MSDNPTSRRVENEKVQLAVRNSFTVPNISSETKVQKKGSMIWDPRLDAAYISNGSEWLQMAESPFSSSSYILSTGISSFTPTFAATVIGNWNVPVYPTSTPSYWDPSGGIYTVQKDGIYNIKFYGSIRFNAGSGTVEIYVSSDGASISFLNLDVNIANTSASNIPYCVDNIVVLTAGQQITFLTSAATDVVVNGSYMYIFIQRAG